MHPTVRASLPLVWEKAHSMVKPLNTQIASILVDTSVCGIFSEGDGDTDMTETTDEPVTALFYLYLHCLDVETLH